MAAKFPPLTCRLRKTHSARPGRGRFMFRAREVQSCSQEGRANPDTAQLNPEPIPGTATPVVVLTNTTRYGGTWGQDAGKHHQTQLTTFCSNSNRLELQIMRGCSSRAKEVSGDSVCPEDSGTWSVSPTWSSVTSNQTASLGGFSALTLPSN